MSYTKSKSLGNFQPLALSLYDPKLIEQILPFNLLASHDSILFRYGIGK